MIQKQVQKQVVLIARVVIISSGLNPFPHTAILQQTTFKYILNIHSAERNEHFYFLSLSFENIVAKDEIAPAGALSQCFQMLSATADVKTNIYGVKG